MRSSAGLGEKRDKARVLQGDHRIALPGISCPIRQFDMGEKGEASLVIPSWTLN